MQALNINFKKTNDYEKPFDYFCGEPFLFDRLCL